MAASGRIDERRQHLRGLPAPAPRDPAGRPPPHDLRAEQAVISAAMLSQAGVDATADMLPAEAFFGDAHQVIWAAILRLARAARPVDLVSVAGELGGDGLERIGGVSYLAEVADKTPAHLHIADHGRMILDKWRRRRVIAEARAIAAEGYSDDAQRDAGWCDAAAERIQAAAQTGQSTAGVWIADSVAAVNAMLDGTGAESSQALSTGMPALDRATGGVARRQVTIIKAPSGIGKSSLARAIGHAVASTPLVVTVDGREVEEPQGVAIFSAEMTDQEVAMELSCSLGGVNSQRLRRVGNQPAAASDDEWRRYTEASRALVGLPIQTIGHRSLTMRQARAQLQVLRHEFRRRFGARIGLVIFDTVQLFGDNEPKERGETQENAYNRVGREMGAIAIDFDCAVLGLSQINKDGTTRGSNAFEQHAQSFWRLYVHNDKVRDGDDPADETKPREAEVVLEKQRFGARGVSAKLWFTPAYTRFDDPEVIDSARAQGRLW